MTTVKTCQKHGELKVEDLKQGIYKGKKYRKCKYCETERSREYTKKIYADKELLKKKHQAHKDRWKNLKEEITKRRQKPECLEKRREWYAKNIDSQREVSIKKGKEYRDKLHDTYIKKIIKGDNKNISHDDIPQSLVDLKRSLMLCRKSIKNKTILNKVDKDKYNEV